MSALQMRKPRLQVARMTFPSSSSPAISTPTAPALLKLANYFLEDFFLACDQ